MSNTSFALYDFLLEDLETTLSDSFPKQENETEAILEFLYVLASIGNSIPEAMVKIYASPLNFDAEQLKHGIAYLAGLGFLSVECSCVHGELSFFSDDELRTEVIDFEEVNPCIVPSDSSHFFIKGFDELRLKSGKWLEIKEKIDNLTEELASV